MRAQLVAGGDFATLAKQYSQDTSTAAQGGDLGLVDNAKVPAVFASFATGAKAGDLSDPIKDTGATTKGVWVPAVFGVDPVQKAMPLGMFFYLTPVNVSKVTAKRNALAVHWTTGWFLIPPSLYGQPGVGVGPGWPC